MNKTSFELESLVLCEGLLKPVLMHGSKTMLWSQKERIRIRAVQMDNIWSLLGVRRRGEVEC